MDEGVYDGTVRNQGNRRSTSDLINSVISLFHPFQAGRCPQTSVISGFPNDSARFSPSSKSNMEFDQRFQPQELNALYFRYLFNFHQQDVEYGNLDTRGQRITEETNGNESRRLINYIRPEITVYPLNQSLQRHPPGFMLNPSSTQDLRTVGDRVEQRGNLGTEGGPKDYWELNRRRPSVIRRSISSNGNCSPREAILTTNFTNTQFNETDQDGKTLEELQSPSVVGIPYESLASPHSTLDSSKESEIEIISITNHSTAFPQKTTEPRLHECLSSTRLCDKNLGTKVTSDDASGEHTRVIFPDPVGPLRKKKKFSCFYCKKRFQWFSHWQAHERIHTGEKPFTCKQCGRCFTRADGLQSHISTHSTIKRYKCSFCSKRFPKKSLLEKHVFEHTGAKPFQCEYCCKQYSDEESIETHLLNHRGEKRFRCQYCNHSFINARRLVRHIRGHTGEKPFKCDVCKMGFSKKSALVIHHRVHTGVKPYSCLECGKAFSISGNLQRHRLIHSGERPYKCAKCQQTFNNPSHLSRHITRQHTR